MPLKQSLQELLDEMEFDSPEDKELFERFLAKDKFGAGIEARVMKNKDYTTKTQQVAETKRQLEAEKEEWNRQQDQYAGTINQYKQDMEQRLNAALKQVSESNLYGAALKNKLSALAATYGEDVDDLLKDVKDIRADDPAPKGKLAFDDEEFKKNFVPRSEYEAATSSYFGFAPLLRDLEREYEDLSGKRFTGSLTDLTREAIDTVTKRRARGEQIDLPTYIREKLDFKGLQEAKAQKDREAAEQERKDWEAKRTEEIERDIRSKIVAENPNAFKEPVEDWRNKLGPQNRNQDSRPSQMNRFQRQQAMHRVYEEQASKHA